MLKYKDSGALRGCRGDGRCTKKATVCFERRRTVRYILRSRAGYVCVDTRCQAPYCK